jgi:hypothetical protein
LSDGTFRALHANSSRRTIELKAGFAGERMESVMQQRTDAAKWFWPFMLVAAVAGATIIALPPFPTKSMLSTAEAANAVQPQFRMQTTVVGTREPHVADRVVAIEPYRIQVTAKRMTVLGGSHNTALRASRADAAQARDQANCAPL